ncbi:ribonuclease HII [Methylonatrum kenyense]|uniref:ribonuclease HII n=1 Tax=Methylonatrum kenyense TaxID=455253 RepID=UPI0020BE88AE|nr:ribonuclease HII [Methylonatrum kenyense]MCK8516389.1 ribonuclease HII [Methylonatrum kenyense]
MSQIELWPASDGPALCAGVDEVGRGPLVGAVVAAAVILDPRKPINGLTDSKKLSARRRDVLAAEIRDRAIAWSIAEASAAEVDQLNILHASMLAMRRAVGTLSPAAESVLVDGNRCPDGLSCPARAIVGGDASEPAIGAASILAKVHRDAQMDTLHTFHPDYGFDRHRGYPTAQHLDALQRLGPLAEHRRSFRPVRDLVQGQRNVKP